MNIVPSLIVIDDFLPYPNIIRNWALTQNFYSDKELTKKFNSNNEFPGKRTIQVQELDIDYANTVLSEIANLTIKYFNKSFDIEISSSFQITTKNDGESWIHKDDNVSVAGVLYLSPNAPISSGTILYSNPPHEIKDKVGNIFNRLVLYKANEYHKSSEYFGSDLFDGRLTQVFFIK